MLHKEAYLRQTYGIPDADARFPTPFSYKQYCRNVLDRHFWGGRSRAVCGVLHVVIEADGC